MRFDNLSPSRKRSSSLPMLLLKGGTRMTQQQGVMTDEAPLGKNQRGTRDGNADTDVPTGKVQYSNPLAEPSTIREARKPDTPIEASTFTQPERAEASGSSENSP